MNEKISFENRQQAFSACGKGSGGRSGKKLKAPRPDLFPMLEIFEVQIRESLLRKVI